MPASARPILPCPTCRATLARVRRRAEDKRVDEAVDLRRYRCSAPECAWEGLLPRAAHRSRLSDLAFRRRRLLKSLRAASVPALAVLGLGAAVAAVVWQAGVFAPRPSQRYAPGEHHDGELLPAAHALSRHHAHAALQAAAAATVAANPADTLALRHGCVWGQPGRNPYRGTVEQALRSAALPEEVVQSVVAQVRDGQPVDRLAIRNDGVHALASGRVFSAQNIAMTYGKTLCLSTRVNFVAGHSEPAALYEAATASGRVVAVMVPEVCGNVSVLGQSDTALRPRVLSARGAADDPAAVRWMPAVLEGPGTTGSGFVGRNAQDVPEPGTLACVLTALGLMGLLRGLRSLRERR
jgi:hypothetical protein